MLEAYDVLPLLALQLGVSTANLACHLLPHVASAS